MVRKEEVAEISASLRCHDLPNISSENMIKACRSFLRQIDWSKVTLDVVDSNSSTVYRAAFQRILQTQIEGILTEACKALGGQDHQEAEETDDVDTEVESDEDDSAESYEHSFVESDEDECDSAEYQGSNESVDDGEDEDSIDVRSNVCAVCRKIINVNDAALLAVGYESNENTSLSCL